MRQELIHALEEITMPEGCEQKIRRAMANRKQANPFRMGRKLPLVTTALVLVLALTACASPVIREAVQKYLLEDIGMTVYEEEGVQTVVYDTESPAFAQVREGRLYFTGNGENRDITDEITEEEPFIYTYQDVSGVEAVLVVGYAGSIENFGIYQFLRQPGGDWFTGTGRNFLNPETQSRYPWMDIVWEKLDIPWPMPE